MVWPGLGENYIMIENTLESDKSADTCTSAGLDNSYDARHYLQRINY